MHQTLRLPKTFLLAMKEVLGHLMFKIYLCRLIWIKITLLQGEIFDQFLNLKILNETR